MSDSRDERKNWLIVACADHVRRGRAGGFMQVNHGKLAPLRRISPGERVVCYSPSTVMRGAGRLQSFTALGGVAAGVPYQVRMGEDFCPFRRDVEWLPANDAPIQPLLGELELTAGKPNWGYQLRRGLLPLSTHDIERIAQAMGIELPRNTSHSAAANGEHVSANIDTPLRMTGC
ncbi:MAG: EVE domain-containing protein [Thermomicrobiales bacterium]